MAHSLPQDIIYEIIAQVGNGHDKHLLQQCALVSASFLLPSRKRLFSHIWLKDDQASQRLHQCLIRNPVILSFVRRIGITEHWRTSFKRLLNSTSLLAILRLPFCYLESFSIISSDPIEWRSFSSELKDTLSNIIHSSESVKALYFREVINVPITLFRGIAHLTELNLDSISPCDFDGVQSGTLTSAASKGAVATAYAVIDQCVWSFHKRVRGPTEPVFLPFMCRLRYFEINIDPDSANMLDFNITSFLMRSLCISLTSPATLEYLKFNIQFYENDSSFDYYRFFEDLREDDVWRHVDSIVTHPVGSRLQRVDINIIYSFRYDVEGDEPDSHEVSEPVLAALPLLREKGILFVKATLE